MSCIICADDYTKQVRREIKCPECGGEACLTCFKRTLLGSTILKCMFPECNKVFSFIELNKLTESNSFSKEIMDKLAKVTFEEEKNFLPRRQDLAKQKLNVKKYTARSIERYKFIGEISEERNECRSQLNLEIRNNKELLDLRTQIHNLKIKKETLNKLLIKEMNDKIMPYNKKIEQINLEDDIDRENLNIVRNDKKGFNYTFIKQCNQNDCKGFLENNSEEKGWKCSLCDKFTCRKCQEPLIDIIDEEGKKIKHECNEDIIINLKEMKKDTKPCPKCGTGIFKIDGCSTMFCISCQTYFDWNSGKIHNKAVHNPDAVRWMRENNRAIARPEGNGECLDPLINNMEYYDFLYTKKVKLYFGYDRIMFNTILSLVDKTVHINEVIIPRFSNNFLAKSVDIAVEYLINDDYIEKKWFSDIKKFKKQQMFNNEISNILSLYIEVVRTVLSNIKEIIIRNNKIDDIGEQLMLVPKLAENCNKNIEEIKHCFGSKRKMSFDIITNKKHLFEIFFR